MNPPEGRIFSSWKEIANFLGKGVRTVQRWEKTLGLPVSRPAGYASNVVVATETELRRWIETAGQEAVAPYYKNESLKQQRMVLERIEQLEKTQQRLSEALNKLEARFEQLQQVIDTRDLLRTLQESVSDGHTKSNRDHGKSLRGLPLDGNSSSDLADS